ncbi:Uncharacterised protein [Candidatus Gugararchaeum adminiculabundum]|nr:Uncharacterised protein [Candidatus Gugararchaeum adminiculabundum]
MNFVTKNNVKVYLKENSMRVSGSLIEALDKKVAETLDSACRRAKANKRTTVMEQDL